MPKQAARKAIPAATTLPEKKNGKNGGATTPEPLPSSLVNSLPASRDIILNAHHFAAFVNQALIPQIEAARQEGPIALARAYVVLHRMNERIEELIKPFNDLVERVKTQDLPQAYEDAGVTSLPLSEGFRVGVSYTKRASVRKDMKEAAIEWLRANDKGDMVKETINAETLSSFARDLAEENWDLPDDIFNVFDKPTTSVTKTK